MPVQIDKIDAEIEIVPAGDHARPPIAPTTGAPARSTRIDLGRVISRTLRDQLDEYLRIRG